MTDTTPDVTSKGIELAEVNLAEDAWAIQTPDGDLTFPGPEEVVKRELERLREIVADDDDDDTNPDDYSAVRLPGGLAG